MNRLFWINVVFWCYCGVSVAGEPALLQYLTKPGYVALIRHALAPGTGDPAHFELSDCQTQRNLSEGGRNQAIRMGNMFREAGIMEAQIFTSQWCRCKETAELFNLGTVQELPALNSFFRKPGKRKPQLQAMRNWLQKQQLEKPTLLVTHQVVITGFTNTFPTSGEIVIVQVLKSGDLKVINTISTL